MSYHSSLKRKIYFALPAAAKSMLASAYGRQQRKIRFGEHFDSAWKTFPSSQYWNAAEIESYQQETLDSFFKNSVSQTPYYQQKGILTFKDAPVLGKKTVQENQSQLYQDTFKNSPHQWGHTSGTTGRSLVFPIAQNCFQQEYAFRALHYSWGGVNFINKEPLAFCSGHPVAAPNQSQPPFWTHDRTNNWLLMSSYHLTEINVAHYIRKLDDFKPTMLGGYPSSLYLLALAYKKHGSGKLKLKSAFTASETLFEHQRTAIHEAFGTKVFNWYGNSEMCGHITECEEGRLHTRHEHSLLEILDPHNKPCKPGETGRIVATGFHNHAFPLVRYEVGDTATCSTENQCPCGRTGQLIDRIEGRNEDYILTPDGRLIGRLDHLFKDSHHVQEAQIIQNSIDEVILRVVKHESYSIKDEEIIRAEALLRLGSALKVNFEYVERIERTSSGKFRFIVSKIDQQEVLAKFK